MLKIVEKVLEKIEIEGNGRTCKKFGTLINGEKFYHDKKEWVKISDTQAKLKNSVKTKNILYNQPVFVNKK